MTAHSHSLDPSSTSPNFSSSGGLVLPLRCIYSSVWFAYQIEGKRYGVTQGCCNHWDCPRCGQIRAKTEYARIVHGIHELSRDYSELYFQTITCRGKALSPAKADAGYLSWTNKLLDSYRARVKKQGGHWAYVQVTERQRRGLPHSHFLTTFDPGDLFEGFVTKWQQRAGILVREDKPALRSIWLQRAVIRVGLGEQYDISKVRNEAAASRYVAKYMFKQTAFDSNWPKGWRRVRYSQSFPKLPELKTDAFVLRTFEDWQKLAKLATVVVPADEEVEEYAAWKLIHNDVIVLRAKTGQKMVIRHDENNDD
jgi:hypothetical protein